MRLAIFVLGMLALAGTFFLADYLSEDHARKELVTAISQSTGVKLDGGAVADPAAVLALLREITREPDHHSSPTMPIRVELTGGPHVVTVIIARDSQNPTEFWVYRAGCNWHNDAMGQIAGGIVSPELDSLLKGRGL